MSTNTRSTTRLHRRPNWPTSACVGILLACLLAACTGPGSQSTGDASRPGMPANLQISAGQTFDLNQAAGFPAGGNTVKLHDACMDETTGTGIAVGILTPYAAIFDKSAALAYVRMDAEDGSGDSVRSMEGGIKNVECGGGIAFVGTEKALVKIDLAAREVVDRVDLGREEMPADSLIFDPSAHRVAYPVVDGGLVVLDSESMASVGTLPVEGRQHVFFRPDGRILAVSLEGATVTEYDGATLEGGSSWQLDELRQATVAAYDGTRDDLWVAEGSTVRVYDTTVEAATPASFELPFAPKDLELDGDFAVALASEKQVVVGSQMALIDVPGQNVVHASEPEQRLKQVDIDPSSGTGWFASSEENAVIAKDLRTGEDVGRVDVGNTAEYGLVAANGRTWIGNRLGGSTLVRLDPVTEETVEVGTGSWPVGAAYSPSRGRIFTWNMLDGTITVIEDQGARQTATWDIGLKGETDAIGDLALDDKRGLLYAVVPEQGLIAAVDADTGDTRGEIRVETRADGPKGLSGPGTLDVAVDEESGTLLAYSASTATLSAFAADDDCRQSGRVQVAGKDLVPYPLYVDPAAGIAYLGPHAYSTVDLEPGESFAGVTRVVAVDHARDLVLTAGEKDGVPILTAHSLSGKESGESVATGEASRIAPTYAYDPAGATVFAYAMTENVVRTFTVT